MTPVELRLVLVVNLRLFVEAMLPLLLLLWFPLLDAMFGRVVIVALAMMVAVAVATAAAQHFNRCAFAAAASCPKS